MKLPFNAFLQCIVVTFTFLSLASCEEVDEALVKKNQNLRQKLSEIEKKVDILEINAGEDPGDQTVALKKANDELAKALEALKQQDEEKEKLEKAHAKMEKDLRDYQKKYRIR